MSFDWSALPLLLAGIATTAGIIRFSRRADPPPLAREFYRPHWEWERTHPLGRRMRWIRNSIGILFAACFTVVFAFKFFGLSLFGL
jgi:hypothetical protein